MTIGHGRQRVDLIVAGEIVVTSDEARPTIERGAVAVEDGRIVAVDTVVVDGQILMHGRRVLTLDEAAIRAGVARISDRVRGLHLGVDSGAAMPSASRPALAACPSCGAPLLAAR